MEPWSAEGIRQYVTRNDVILYSVDEIHSYVYIRSVCTRGRNLDLHLSEQSESVEENEKSSNRGTLHKEGAPRRLLQLNLTFSETV